MSIVSIMYGKISSAPAKLKRFGLHLEKLINLLSMFNMDATPSNSLDKRAVAKLS